MKNLDNHIQEILSSKLGNLETEVSPHVWSGIESQLAQQAAAAGSSAVAKSVAAKWLWAAAIATTVTVATVAIVLNNQPEQTIAQPTTIETTAPAVENQNILSPEPASSGSENVLQSPLAQQPSSEQITINYTENVVPDLPAGELTTEIPFKPELPAIQLPAPQPASPEVSVAKPSDNGNANTENNPAIETPTAHFTPIVVDQKELRYFFIPAFSKGVQYSWNMGDGSTYESASPTHEFSAEGEYLVQLTIQDETGKQFTDQIEIKAYKPVEVKIPTIFSPNGDGKNDLFEFELLSGQVNWTRIVILSESGPVFESDGSEMWGGLDKHGNECSEGTYTYLVRGLDKNQGVIEKTGLVMLRRSR